MTGDRDEALGRLTEELSLAIAADESIVLAAWAQRFGVEEADVQACLRALRLLDDGLGEEPDEGPPELPPPTLPADYELLGELGRGGMGVVYRARQRSLGREVAVKVLRPGDLVFGDALRRFRSEAQSLARLRHRHIVSVHDLGENADGTLWFAMDLIDGTTLADEAAKRRRNSPAQVVRILRQVASAIAHAHAHGIVHRDLKPQNVLLDRDGNAFVCDFGLARDAAAAGARTLTGELLGTPAYMSPEQARGDAARIGEATDVWALGAVLYELLTGRGPFRGMPLHETIRAILEDDPPRPRSLDANVPAELEAVCLKALQKRPEQRYPTALAFAEDLERFADGRGVLARAPGRVARGARWLRRRAKPVLAAFGAVIVTVLAVLLWLPTLKRSAVLDEAQRLIAAGEAAAPIKSLERLLHRASPHTAESHAIELLLARAHNDIAAAALFRGDDPCPEAEQALAYAEQHEPRGDWPHADAERLLELQPWLWEIWRARSMLPSLPTISPQTRTTLEWLLSRRERGPTHTDELSETWVETRLGLRFSNHRFSSASRGDWQLKSLLRATAHALQAGWSGIPDGFPCCWTGRDIDDWWNPSLDQTMADLATDAGLPAAARAIAFVAFCQLQALPSPPLAPTASDASKAPDYQHLAAAAERTIAGWRDWSGLPPEARMRARIDLLVEASVRPGDLLPGCEDRIVGAITSSLAVHDLDVSALPAWWAHRRGQSMESLLRNGLGISAQQDITLVEALDHSAATNDPAAMAWRQLAWLRLPAKAAVPQCAPDTSNGGIAWRSSCLIAAELADPRRFRVHLAIVRFDESAAQPAILDSTSYAATLGDPLHGLAFARFARVPTLTRRQMFEDERKQQRQRIYPLGPSIDTIDGALGMCYGWLDARLGIEGDGFQIHACGRLVASGPQQSGRMHDGEYSGPVLVGTAACLDSLQLAWLDGERHTTLQLLVALTEESAADHEPAPLRLEDWRAAAMRHIELVAARGASFDTRAVINWALPAWWPMPEVAASLEQLAEHASPSRSIKAALQLAGRRQGVGLWASKSEGVPRSMQTAHVATATRSAEVRNEVLADLSQLEPEAFTPAIAAALHRAAEQREFPLPPALDRTLGRLPSGVWHWLFDDRGWKPLLGLGFVVWLLWSMRAPQHRPLARTAVGILVPFVGLEWRVQVGEFVLTPSFVLLAVGTSFAATAHRAWPWFRRAALLAMLGIVVWTALAWWGVIPPPQRLDSSVLVLLGLLGAGGYVPVRRRRTEPGRAPRQVRPPTGT